jgi:hypothetical protein
MSNVSNSKSSYITYLIVGVMIATMVIGALLIFISTP